MASRISNASSSSSSSSTGAHRTPRFARNREGFESDRADREYSVGGSLHQKPYYQQQSQQHQNRRRKESWNPPEKSQGNWTAGLRFDNSNRATASGNLQPSYATIEHGNATFVQARSHISHGNGDFGQGNSNFGQANANFGHGNANADYVRGGSSHGQGSANHAHGDYSGYGHRSANYSQGHASYTRRTANYAHGHSSDARGSANYDHESANYAHRNVNSAQGRAHYVGENTDSHYPTNPNNRIRVVPSDVSYDGIRRVSGLRQSSAGNLTRGESGSNYTHVMNLGDFGSNNDPILNQGEYGSHEDPRLNYTHVLDQSQSRREFSLKNTHVVKRTGSTSHTTYVVNQLDSRSSHNHAVNRVASVSNNTGVMSRSKSGSNNSRDDSGANTCYSMNRLKLKDSERFGLSRITRHNDESKEEFPPLPTAKTEIRSSEACTSTTMSPEPSSKSIWGSLGTPIRSWYDECEDASDMSPPLDTSVTRDFTPKNVEESYGEDHESPNSSVKGGPKGSHANDFYKKAQLQNDAPRRNRWRKNTQHEESSITLGRQNMQQVSCVTPSGEASVKSPSKISWRQKDHKTKKDYVDKSTESREQFEQIGLMRSGREESQIPYTRKRMEEMQKYNSPVDAKESVANQDPSTQVDDFAEGGADETLFPFIIGTCEDMCPVREREQRERLRDLSVFERANGNPCKTTRDLAVKKFCRTLSSTNFQASDIRPLPTLKKTLHYLLNLLDDSEFAFDVVHDFLFDRTRAIRQELDMQRIVNSQAINMYEQIVRFHILSEHELHQRLSLGQLSNSHLNLQQLSKSLLSLFNLYSANPHEMHKNEPEFRAYYVLLNLGSNKHFQADSLSLWFRECTSVLMNTRELKFARAVLRCYHVGNFWKFFQLVHEATFLQSCLMEVHFNEARLKSLEVINHGGYKLHPIPLVDISKELLIKEGDLEELCKLSGLSTGMDSSRVRCLFVKQSPFSAPIEIPSYRCPCILNKRPPSYYETVVA